MAGIDGGEKLALLDREATRPKEQKPVDLSVFKEQRDFQRANRIQELTDRAEEIGSMTFFPAEEEVQKLLREVESERSALLLVENGHTETDTDWKEVAIDIAKDLLVPDEIDIALFLATGPAGPTLSKIAKVPKALGKLISHIPPEAKKYLRESLETFFKEGNPEPLNKLSISLRKTPDPLNHELAAKIEEVVAKKAVESTPGKQVAKKAEKMLEHRIKPEPKLAELTAKEVEFFKNDLHALSWMRNDLHKIYAGGMHEGKKGIETLYTTGEKQLEQFEKFIVYQRDMKHAPPGEINKYLSDYLGAMTDVIESYGKGAPKLNSIEDAKKYLVNLKNTYGTTR